MRLQALGALLRACNRHKEAGLHYHWALHHCRWSPLLLSNACNWLRDKGEAKESLIWLYKGLQEWPQDLHLRWGQVLSLHKAERPQQALHYLDELIQEQGQRPLLLQERVACLLSCGRNDEALSTLKALRGQKPQRRNTPATGVDLAAATAKNARGLGSSEGSEKD